MGRTPRCSNDGLNKGAWTVNEDKILVDYIKTNGEGRWSRVSRETGLKRCGKSCRLRWMNYLRPDIKRGNISSDEEELIIRLHKLLGNRWSLIAGRLPGRTDNEIKNYWNTNLAKKASEVQLSQFRTFSLKPQNVATLPEYSLSVPLQAKPLDCRVSPDLNPDGGNSLLKQTAAAYDSDFSDRSPSLSLNSTDDLMMNFNVDSDDICQILDSDFSQINQVYIDDLLSPEAELEVDAYINMVEDQDIRNRLSSCFESPEAMEKNSLNGGDSEEDCMIGSDFPSLASAFESDQVKWSGLGDGDNDLNIVFQEENATGN